MLKTQLILGVLIMITLSSRAMAQTLEINGISAKGDQICLEWSPPIDGIAIELVRLDSQQITPIFVYAKPGDFISRACFMDTNKSTILRMRWHDGARAVYIPQAEVPIQVLAFRSVNPSNSPIQPENHPPIMANVTGEHLFIPEGQPLSSQISLAQFKNLRRLDLWDREIRDISFLEGLSQLDYVHLGGNLISDATPIAKLVNLTAIFLNNNRISDLAPLHGLTKLAHVYVSHNQINDLSPLAECRKLVDVSINNNQISDLSPLRHLTAIGTLEMSDNPISDLEPLRNLTNLVVLGASSCRIQSISALAGLQHLDSIKLNRNEIKDLAPLAPLRCMVLSLRSNQVHDISPLLEIASHGGFISRRGCEVGLDLRDNPLSQKSIDVLIPELEKRCGIKVLH